MPKDNVIPVPDLKATNSFSRISDSGDLLRISSRLIQIWYQNEFAQAQRVVDDNIQMLGRLHNHQQASQGTYRQEQSGRLKAEDCIQYYNYFCAIERKMAQQAVRIRESEAEAEVRRTRLEIASRDRLVIDELKKADFRRFRREALKMEQMYIDEAGYTSADFWEE